MANNHEALLKDKDVIAEIDRYKWVESEKAGHDIGFEKASREWLDRHAGAWAARHSGKKIGLQKKPKSFLGR